MAASTSSLTGNIESAKYEVFISFRGSDVRSGFLSHLHAALEAEQIHAFVDNYLERGRDITLSLFNIITQSDLSIVVFSPNYAKSKWCLEELEKIHESMNQGTQIVVPLFYQVDPSDVQELKGNYAIQSQKWRDALVEISNLSGFVSNNSEGDGKLVKDIVADVSKKLRNTCPTTSSEEGLFGIDSSIEDVESLLCLDLTNDVKMVGIWGMGGIGKTTIASKVFDKIKKKFRGYCFVSNVRETLGTRDGLIYLRDKIINDLLRNKDTKADSPFSVDGFISRRLKRIQVLLVLDDVHTCMELKSLLGSSGLSHPDSFCPGSRIIVTSRDSQVLKDVKFKSTVYEAKQLKDDEALQLLSWNAFGQNQPQQGYEKISKEVIRYGHGVPLALVVLGSQLKHKKIRFWEEALKKVKSISPLEIQKILRVSFDGLDRDEKNIFLDIACFWKGYFRDHVERVLGLLGYHVRIGIDGLIDKSLLKEEHGAITMHDLLQQMGHEIVAKEKEMQGQKSRLWKFDDAKDALTNTMGTEVVEAIQLSYYSGNVIDICSEAFVHMRKLRYLNLDNRSICCHMGLEYLPNSIKYLKWASYPLNYLPSSYNADKLVVLEMSGSGLEQIDWSKPLNSLNRVDLRSSVNLKKISDLALAPNLETLKLKGCINLVEVGSSLENLSKLTSLDVSNCKSLSHLPELPCTIEKLKLAGSGLRQLPSKIGCLTLLKHLWLNDCMKLESLPSSISCLSSLQNISLLYCVNLQKLPDDFGNLESLKALNASRSGLRELPRSFQNLKNLTMLDLTGCQDLMELPEDFGNLESLRELCASGSGLKELPQSIQKLQNLMMLKLCSCKNLVKLPEDFGNLVSLKEFDASYSGLRELPESFQNLKSLIKLDFHACWNLLKLPEDFGFLESLEDFDASSSGLRELPESIRNLQNLKNLDWTGCKELLSIPPLPSNLESFFASTSMSLLNKVSSSILAQYFLKKYYQPTKAYHLCVNRSELPEWMMYRNECGSSITLELETHGHSINFIFCLVSSPNRSGFFSFKDVVATLQSDEISETEHYFDHFEAVRRNYYKCVEGTPQVMFLWTSNLNCRLVNKVSFRVRNGCLGKIIKCGVHLIFHTKNGRKRRSPDSADLD